MYISNLPKNLSISLNILNIVLAAFISIGALVYIYDDYNNSKYIQKNSSTKYFLVFFLFCILASIINGNGFQKYNNIYFVIHSALFFLLMLLNNNHEESYKKNLTFLIMLILCAITIVSIITILINMSNRFGITETFKSESLKEFFYISAPVRIRWYTILTNANTYAHLVSMTFFLALIPLFSLKKISLKIIVVVMQLINIVTLIFTGSRGALLAILCGIIILIFSFIIFIAKKKSKSIFKIFLVLVIIFIFIQIIIFNILKYNLSIKYFLFSTLRLGEMKNIAERLKIWNSLLHLPLFSKPFGYSDNYIYNYMSSLNIKDYKVFLNNQGRAHNMFLQALVSFGSIGFVLFITCLIKTFIQVIKNHNKINTKNKMFFNIFLIQFIVILIGGMFEQLPLFSLSPHALLFMFVWANLLTISDTL